MSSALILRTASSMGASWATGLEGYWAYPPAPLGVRRAGMNYRRALDASPVIIRGWLNSRLLYPVSAAPGRARAAPARARAATIVTMLRGTAVATIMGVVMGKAAR